MGTNSIWTKDLICITNKYADNIGQKEVTRSQAINGTYL